MCYDGNNFYSSLFPTVRSQSLNFYSQQFKFMNFRFLKLSIASFVLILLTLINIQASFAQSCNCNYTVELNATVVDGAKLNLGPGSVVCLKAGPRQILKLVNFRGSATNPIVVKNCGGQVVISNSSLPYGISVESSRYLKLSGRGDSNHKYGIKISRTGSGASGLGISGLSSDVEVENFEISNVGFAGILAKTNGAIGTWMENINIHDNFIHDVHGEGMYIGETKTPGQNIRNLKVWNNVVTRTGWEPFQVSNGVENIEVFNNVFYKGGLENRIYQNKGFQVGDNTVGRFYNNVIIGTPSTGVLMVAAGKIEFFNNYLEDMGDGAFFIDNRTVSLSNTAISIYKNYFVDVKNNKPIFSISNEINLFNIYDNKYTGTNPLVTYGSGAGSKIKLTNNTSQALTKYQFRNAAGNDFRVAIGSPYTGIGLLESSTAITPPPTTFTVSAGSNKTLTLPTNSVTLNGIASGATVASYAWTKVSGPSATMAGATTANLALSNLVAGTYVFRLTAKSTTGATATSDATVAVVSSTGQTVTSFTLVNADTDKDIATLTSGYVINYSTIGTKNLNIRANTNPGTVGSVVFSLNGAAKTESVAPYTFGGDAVTSTGTNYNAMTALATGTHSITATPYSASSGSGTKGTPLTVSFSVTTATTATTTALAAIRINCGGSSYTTPSGVVFAADKNFSTGSSTFTNNNIVDIANTTSDAMYKSERSGSIEKGTFSYNIPVASGTYTVVLHFAEIWFGATGGAPTLGQTGKRVFGVSMEGQTKLSNFDIIAATGTMKAITKSFNQTVTDGTLNINFISQIGRAKISAIEVIPSTTTGTMSTEAIDVEPISAYPNPFTDKITVDFGDVQDETASILLYDQLGRIVYQNKANIANGNSTIEINLEATNLNPGLYILKIESNSTKAVSKKLIKR